MLLAFEFACRDSCFRLGDGETAVTRRKIYLLPLGFRNAPLLDRISAAVEKAFDLPAGRLQSVPLPEYAYNESRGQYHSPTILKSLAVRVSGDALRLLAVTEADLYVPQLSFVFGEAAVDGRVCIISLYRLRPEFYGRPPDELLFVERAAKEAIHELGHTFGLRHCPDQRCVMYFSNSIRDTDRKSAEFCAESAEHLEFQLDALKAAV